MDLEKYKQLYSEESEKYKNAKTKGLISEKWIAQGKKEMLALIINDIVCEGQPDSNTDEANVLSSHVSNSADICPECGYEAPEHKHGCSEYYTGR